MVAMKIQRNEKEWILMTAALLRVSNEW